MGKELIQFTIEPSGYLDGSYSVRVTKPFATEKLAQEFVDDWRQAIRQYKPNPEVSEFEKAIGDSILGACQDTNKKLQEALAQLDEIVARVQRSNTAYLLTHEYEKWTEARKLLPTPNKS